MINTKVRTVVTGEGRNKEKKVSERCNFMCNVFFFKLI